MSDSLTLHLVPKNESGSARILQAREILRDLLLENEQEINPLVGQVAEDLDEIVLELDRMAGLQLLFEVWANS